MAKLTIKPKFIPDSTTMFFANKELNSLQRSTYTDTFGFYQNMFRLFGYMKLNKKNKFVVHMPKGHPLVWQKWEACSYDETGSLTMGTRELEPDPIYLKETFCHDELLSSAYEHMLTWAESGLLDLDEDGVRLVNTLMAELMANINYGFRITATAGDLYNVNSVPKSTENTVNLDSLFKKTHGSFKGWLRLAIELGAAQYPWMNLAITDSDEFDEIAGYQGNILTLLNTLKAQARKPLRQLINRGGIIRGQGLTFLPLIVLSDSYFNAVIARYNYESDRVATNRVRITERTFGGMNTPTPQRIFYLDNMLPIIPLEEINGFDPYLLGQTHFAGIIASGNLQIGASFTPVDDIEDPAPAILMDKNRDITRSDYGKYTVLSHALTKVAIADPNYFVGTITYTEPAAA